MPPRPQPVKESHKKDGRMFLAPAPPKFLDALLLHMQSYAVTRKLET